MSAKHPRPGKLPKLPDLPHIPSPVEPDARMDALPPELLSQIFSYFLPIRQYSIKNEAFEWERTTTLTDLRLVSRGWNQVILDTPKLWTYIEINSQTAGVDQYLSRSGKLSLYIQITVDSSTVGSSHFWKAVDAVLRCTDRWQAYSLKDVRKFNEISSEPRSLTSLVPSQPLPALQIASLFLPGDPGSGIALNAPALNKLHICARKKVRLVECHALKSLSLQGLLDWAGIMLSLLDCSEIERLSIVGVTGAEFTSPEKPIPTSIALPALKELELNSELGDLQFLARLEVPQLQTLTFKCYSSPVPFTLPPSASSLVTLRFTTGSRINAIRRAVAAQPLFQQLTVEIDASAAYRPKHAPRNDFEQVKSDRSWLERHARIKWIGQESVPSHLFQTWEAAHGLVPL